MLKSVTVINFRGDSLLIDLKDPSTSGLIIEKIEGIGPAESNIVITEAATSDGGTFNSARTTTRNIVMTLRMFDDIEASRQLTYKYFPNKKPVTLIFETDYRISYCTGYVESNTPDIFSEQESCQISILCPSPYLYSLKEQNSVLSGVEKIFSFPFSNPSYTEKKLVMSAIHTLNAADIVYEGDEEIGIGIHITTLLNITDDIIIYNTDTGEQMLLDMSKFATITGQAFGPGDEIIINTNRGSKSALLLRGGVYSNIIQIVDRGSSWFKISKGSNRFSYITNSNQNAISFNITNNIIFSGV